MPFDIRSTHFSMCSKVRQSLATFSIWMIIQLLLSCDGRNEDKPFIIRHADETGIDFVNAIQTNDTLNALTFEYIYNGGGIGIGDFNNDGLEDIFMGGNQVSSELYLNRGKLQFDKVTSEAGVSTSRWITGVSVVDINADGNLDIYACVGGKVPAHQRKNVLFINQGVKNGIPQFEEQASSFGIDDDSYSTMAAFLDYDRDGDFDMYLVNNWLESFNRNNLRPKRMNGEAESTDKLYRNNGNNTFTDVSREAGILIEGYGLGVSVSDINMDSWPDIYVSNDFMSNDLLWINQRDGTFKNEIAAYLKHQTHNGMGIDIADFNNDALQDIMVVDMLPPGHKRQKLMTPGQNYDHFNMSVGMGYQPQYMRNTLQLNRGPDQNGNVLFSEIAFLSGVAQTDWSWAPLFADLNNDGWKDLFIANGYRKDVTNLDFIFFGLKSGDPQENPNERKKIIDQEFRKIDDVKLSNYVFMNDGTLAFQDKTEAMGCWEETFSNGAAYADFDNDGDVDLITNNIDQEITLYENRARQQSTPNHFLVVHPDAENLNQKIWIYSGGLTQYQEYSPYRGFQSTVSGKMYFGLGASKTIDSLRIVWSDSVEKVFYNIKVDTTLKVAREGAKCMRPIKKLNQDVKFRTVTPVNFVHEENSSSDIKITRTLLHELTRRGPCIAVGDVNGDELDDFFLGGEARSHSQLFIQKNNGLFMQKEFARNEGSEDGAALFFDADADGDEDLYVGEACRSSNVRSGLHELYLNNGSGKFTLSKMLPPLTTSASCVKAADYDKDGDLDLFVGGHILPSQYPESPRSYLLRNDKHAFSDVTEEVAPGLTTPGVVTDALWVDVDKDGRIDLLIAGEWMPLKVFMNQGKFAERTQEYGLADTHGWWTCLQLGDLNNDGYDDVIAGNTGKNSFFRPSSAQPVRITAKDFDGNGYTDPIVTYHNPLENDEFMVHNRLVLLDQIPAVKRRFETFTKFAETPFKKAFKKDELAGAVRGEARVLSSMMLLNDSGTRFNITELPELAQISTLNDIVMTDLNKDGRTDIIGVGNNYAQETLFGRYDASIGTILLNAGDGKLNSVEALGVGFVADGDTRNIEMLRTTKGSVLVVTNNNGPLEFFLLKD